MDHKSKKDLTDYNQVVDKAAFLPETKGKSIFLSSPDSRGCQHSLAHGSFLHLKSQQ